MDPCVLSEDKSVELFTEVLDHVISFWFTVDKEVKADLLLEANDALDLLLDEVLILGLSNLALVELGTGVTDFLGLLMAMDQ